MICALASRQFDQVNTEKVRETSKVTAIALACISILFLAAGSAFLGLGMSRRFMSMGIGLIPYLGGFFCLTLGIGTLALSVPFATTQLFPQGTRD